jgi:hypothetical protein
MGHQYAGGTPVYDESGQRVGTLDVDETADYLVVHPDDGSGPLFLPLNAVNRSDESGIYLNVTADVLRDPRWRTPPTPGA